MAWRQGLRQALRLAALLLTTAGTAFAATPTLIASCPTTISAAGFYQVATPLTASDTCITIDTPNVTLNIKSSITGNGTAGTGVVIASGATGAVIRGGSISKFDIGIEDDAGDAVIGDIAISQNKTTGLFFNGSDASPSRSDNMSSTNNGHDGVHIKSPAGARLNDCIATDNGTYGVWVDGASNSFVSCSAGGNGSTNVEVAGSSNFIQGGDVFGSPFGVVLEAGAKQNVIAEMGVDTTAGEKPATKDDAVDKNKNCDHNLWFTNFFKTRKPASCVH